MRDDNLWVEKYRPKTVEECILPKKTQDYFREIVAKGDMPNLLLAGVRGTGKTTAAKAMCNQLGCDVMFINASDERNIDTIRNKVKQFASTVSLSEGRKVVILDEADNLNPQSTQPALRAFIEQFSNNCRFILTCNHPNRIIPELHSRCKTVEFTIPKEERKTLKARFANRVAEILTKENVKFQPEVIVQLIERFFPDNRKVLMELEGYAVAGGGTIDEGILILPADIGMGNLYPLMKAKKYNDVRKWVADASVNDINTVFREIFNTLDQYIDKKTIPSAVVILADYQYKAAFVVDQEINLLACVTELMMQCEFV